MNQPLNKTFAAFCISRQCYKKRHNGHHITNASPFNDEHRHIVKRLLQKSFLTERSIHNLDTGQQYVFKEICISRITFVCIQLTKTIPGKDVSINHEDMQD